MFLEQQFQLARKVRILERIQIERSSPSSSSALSRSGLIAAPLIEGRG